MACPPCAFLLAAPLASCSTFGDGDEVTEAGAEADVVDASADRADVDTCRPIQNVGKTIPVTILTENPPDALGGAVVPGTYTLSQYVRYVGNIGTPTTDGADLHTATLVLEATRYAFIEDRSRPGVTAKDERAGDFVVAGKNITWKEVCSRTSSNEIFSYTSNADTLVLYRTAPLGDPPGTGYPVALVFKKM